MAQPRLSGLFAERYLIERELGHGASAVVYLAKDTKQDREIALKVLSKDLAHALGPERFQREIHVTSRLQHPHILPIFDSGESNGLLYYVMPLVSGESLRDKIDREKQLPMDEAARITCEIAEALSHAHAAGVIHRDVKPENVMLSDGHALLADFGIARALDVHTGERLTSSGLIVGTSAYMSPEQASGEERIDARSDIYGLGCVLYEMLAGVQPFTGPTTQSVIAQRFTHAPRPITTYRPAVTPRLEGVIQKALAVSPADRYQRVQDFAAALPDSPGGFAERRGPEWRRVVYGNRRWLAAAAVTLAIVSMGFVLSRHEGGMGSLFTPTALDSTKYAVIPSGGASAPSFAADSIYRTLEKWNGISLVDADLMREAIAKTSDTTIDGALTVAKRFGAGRMVVTRDPGPNSKGFRIALYDVQSGTKIRDVASEELRDLPEPYAAAMYALLRNPDRPKRADGGDGRTNSLPAWLAYGRAHAALEKNNFRFALAEFTSASEKDPDFIPALIWKSQLQEWYSSDSVPWAGAAIRIGSRLSGLSAGDSTLGAAVFAMAQHRFPDACTAYESLTRQNADDFVAWFGAGECREKDSVVVRDRRSGNVAFRSSLRKAVENFEHAIALCPELYSTLSMGRMQGLLPSSRLKIRGGWGDGGKVFYAAYPAIDHDTLAFVPVPAAKFGLLPPNSYATRPEALKQNRRHLLAYAADWARRAPESADAFEALAVMLEAAGEITADREESAVSALKKAQRLSRDPAQGLRLAAADVRLRFKQGDFPGARYLADSVLKAQRGKAVSDPIRLAILAGLIGHASEMAHWTHEAEIPRGLTGANVPPAMRETAAQFFAYSALGICGSATENLEADLERQLNSYTTVSERAEVRAAAEERALSMLVPCTSGASALRMVRANDRLYRAQQAYARGQLDRLRAILDTISLSRKTFLPGEVSFDYTYQEAWLKAAVGDTTAAIQSLDLALDALPGLSASAIDEPAAAAAIGRAMVLRVDLASARNDERAANKWSQAVIALWGTADKELQPAVEQMRLAGARK